MFHFKLGRVTDPFSGLDGLFGLSSKVLKKEPSLLREELMGRACDFGECHGIGTKSNHVTITSDINSRLKILTFDGLSSIDLKEFGVQRPCKNLQGQRSDFGTNRKHEYKTPEWDK